MQEYYPVIYKPKELEKRPEEKLDEAAETFRAIGQVALAIAAVLGSVALLIRLSNKQKT